MHNHQLLLAIDALLCVCVAVSCNTDALHVVGSVLIHRNYNVLF